VFLLFLEKNFDFDREGMDLERESLRVSQGIFLDVERIDDRQTS
jgi:hypothetical protein